MSGQSFQQAVALHRQGQLEAAARLYRQLLDGGEGPHTFDTLYLLALLRHQQGRHAEALAALKPALARNPAVTHARMLHGTLLQILGQGEEALEVFAQVTAREPGNMEAWYNRGVVLAGLGRPGEAVESFDRALAVRPTPDCWNNRGAALQALGRDEEALRSFDAALALHPDYVQVWANRAAVLQRLRRLDEALAACDQALSRQPDAIEALTERGEILLRLKRHAESLADYDRIVAIRPDHAAGWNNRGTALQSLKRYDDAIASYDRALALEPGYLRARVQRAAALHNLYRLEEALAELETALAAQPDHSEALFTRARVLCERNRVGEAHGIMRRLAVQGFGSRPLQESGDTPQKRRHDAEQLEYLRQRGIDGREGIHFEGGEALAGPAVNPLNSAAVEAEWRSRQPSIAVIDNLLTPEALEGLRRFCLGSTIWRRSYDNGYLGAMGEHGFACPLLAQIADELRATFPGIFRDHALRMMWGFKYDSDLKGIAIHADQAAVNLNFWITPDEANTNPDTGGLVLWDAYAPLEWDFSQYNGDVAAARAFLAGAGARPVTVPHRANRAVIFDSNLFHETDKLAFKDGYLNRRINITMLYGRRTSDGS